MDFRQLEAFIRVVEQASFTKAADDMHISQPSVSTYITALEKELETVLINRSTKVMSTTLAGERFLEKAKEMMAIKRESVEMLKKLTGDISGEIRVLASSVPALYILPKIFAGFHALYPSITFKMSQADTSEVVQGISSFKADLGFAGSTLADKKCEFVEFADETLVFIAPNNGKYLERKKYRLDELLYSNSFISREVGSGTRIQYEKYFTENGIVLHKIKTCASMDSTHSIINAVIGGLGISIVSELAVSQMIEHKLLMRINLVNNLPKRKLYMVFGENIVHSHLVKHFVEYVKNTPFQNNTKDVKNKSRRK